MHRQFGVAACLLTHLHLTDRIGAVCVWLAECHVSICTSNRMECINFQEKWIDHQHSITSIWSAVCSFIFPVSNQNKWLKCKFHARTIHRRLIFARCNCRSRWCRSAYLLFLLNCIDFVIWGNFGDYIDRTKSMRLKLYLATERKIHWISTYVFSGWSVRNIHNYKVVTGIQLLMMFRSLVKLSRNEECSMR